MTRGLVLSGTIGLLWLVTSGCNVDADGSDGGRPDQAANPDMGASLPGPDGMRAPLPLVTPPVRAATPAGLQPSPHQSRVRPNLSASDIKSRFFTAGPTSIFNILGSIDDRIAGINQMIQTSGAACFTQVPVPYSITPFGQTITMYAQCYQKVGSNQPADPGFLQFGQKDGVTYLYQAIGQGEVAAVITPVSVDGGNAGDYQVEAWISVGTLNAATSCGGHANWDGCSYGVIHLSADSATQRFEMTVAGIGFGYCGAQLKSDGTNIFSAGSTDMGSTCNAVDTLCVAAIDATTPATCGASVSTFTLAGLGRDHAAGPTQSWAASEYPAAVAGTGNTVLDGTTSDALYFGPTAPAAGASNINN